MNTSIRFKKRFTITVLAVTLSGFGFGPAKAVDTSADPTYAELKSAIVATKAALSAASSLSFNEQWLSVDPNKNARKNSTLITVTPNASEYFNQNLHSEDKQKTWKNDSPLGNHVYVLGSKVYSTISNDQSFGAGYSDYMVGELRKFSPFTASWVVSEATGPNVNRNAMDPVSNAASYIDALDAVNSYLDIVNSVPPISKKTNSQGNSEYKVDFNPQVPSLSYTYIVNPSSGLLVSFGFTSVTEGTRSVATYAISMGEAVSVQSIDPTTLDSIDIAEIIKRARGYTAQDRLRVPAQLISSQTTIAAKKLHKKVSAALVSQTAFKLFGKSNVKAVVGGVRLTGTYQNETAYLCVLVKNYKMTIKGCNESGK